jgi:hypothetical protein
MILILAFVVWSLMLALVAVLTGNALLLTLATILAGGAVLAAAGVLVLGLRTAPLAPVATRTPARNVDGMFSAKS